MASPWRHPQTGSYYLRRQIPEPLRPFFNGKSLWKVSLRTKDPVQAAKDFPIANADLERRFAEAREMLSHAAAARVVAPEMEILRTGADPLSLLDGSLCTTDKLHQALSEQPVVTIMGSHPEHSSASETIFRIERHLLGI